LQLLDISDTLTYNHGIAIMSKDKPSLTMLYLVVAAHCVFGGLFAAFLNLPIVTFFGDSITPFVAGVAGALGSFFLTFFTMAKAKASKRS